MKRWAWLPALLWLAAAGNPDDLQMSAEQQKTAGLQLAPAEQRAITEPVHAPGMVAFDQNRVASVQALQAGRVRRLRVQPGDRVQAGQVLAELDMPGLVMQQADLATAQAQIRESQAGVLVARAALNRAQILTADGSMARAELEQRRLAAAQAAAAADTARLRASALRAQIARLNPGGAPGMARLLAPIQGVVAKVGAAPGEMLDSATEAFLVADPSVMLVTAQIPEAGAALVAVGDAAQLSQPGGGGRLWQARVVALGAALDPQTRTLPARMEVPNPDGALRAGMFLEATITTKAGRQGVLVPAAAVQTAGDRHIVFTQGAEGHFTARTVKLGVERPDWVEIRSGLSAGETVVTKGSFALKSMLQQALLGGAG